MIKLIVNFLHRKRKNNNDRQNYGIACGIAGIFFNVILFVLKFIIGTISNSIAITADAFNNLSDAGSSIITLVGFALSGLKPDTEHPFGHGRFEYVAGLIVSLLIILMGFELFIKSAEKIMNPTDITYQPALIYVLLIAIAVKLYMAYYNDQVGRKIDSATIRAAVTDSLSDTAATSLVLIAILINHFYGVAIDGYAGLLVAGFITKGGIDAARDTISPLLGQPPTPDFVAKIKKIIASYPEIIGIHDLIVHNYGPYRVMVSLHAEVPANADILTMHDIINDAEDELKQTLKCEAIIHMDPIITDDQEANRVRLLITNQLQALDERITIHDFRMIHGSHRSKLFFDVAIPYDVKKNDNDILTEVNAMVTAIDPDYIPTIGIDRD